MPCSKSKAAGKSRAEIKSRRSIMEYVTLNNGVKMPVLGYGVY